MGSLSLTQSGRWLGGESRVVTALYLGLKEGKRRNAGAGVRAGHREGFGVPAASEGTPSAGEIEDRKVGEEGLRKKAGLKISSTLKCGSPSSLSCQKSSRFF